MNLESLNIGQEILVLTAYGMQGLVIFMWMRSGAFILRIRKYISSYQKFVYMAPVIILGFLAIYNFYDLDYLLLRYPVRSIGGIAAAWAIYEMSRTLKENEWSIDNVLKGEWSIREKSSFKKIKAKGLEISIVTSETLAGFKMYKRYGDKHTIVKRTRPPKRGGAAFKFQVDMLYGGRFDSQRHPDLEEEIYIDSGVVREIVSGEIYKTGQTIYLEKNQPHGLEALERTQLTAYLYK